MKKLHVLQHERTPTSETPINHCNWYRRGHSLRKERENTKTSRKLPKKTYTRGITRVHNYLHEAQLTIRQNHRADKTKLSKCLSIIMKMTTKIVADRIITQTTGPMPTSETIASPTEPRATLKHPQQQTISETCTGGTEWTKPKRKTTPGKIGSKMPANNRLAIKATTCSTE